MKILCVFGKYQYGDPSRGIGTEYTAFLPALKSLGHEVVHFESWDRSCYQDYAELNKALLETVEREKPDVLLSVQMNYEIWLETLQIIKARGDLVTICWTTDDSWKYMEVSRFIGGSYHAMTTTYPQALPKYHNDGISHVFLTQWAANAEMLQEPLPASSCRYLVSFIGAAHGDRKERISELKSFGLDVSCFGQGWPASSINADEIPRIMRESVINLNFTNSKGQNQIKARTFEVPGAGGFLLTEDAPGLEKFYIVGKEIEVFHGMKNLFEKAKYYLAHPDKRDIIARAGYERTKREHIYDIRIKAVLDFALEAKAAWVSNGNYEPPLSFEAACRRHHLGLRLKVLRSFLMAGSRFIWGEARGSRAARRLVFELSWRLAGAHTYSAAGWPGRMFYKVS